MSVPKTLRAAALASALFVFPVSFTSAQASAAAPPPVVDPARVVLGGRAVVMVADAVFAFPAARAAVVSVAGTDQGLGTFLEAVDPGFLAKPALDRTAGAEAFAALRPDLVILKSSMKASLGAGLSALGIPALYLDLETPQDFFVDLAALGTVFSSKARADELIAYYKEIIARTAKATQLAAASGKPKPRVLVVQAARGAYDVPPDGWIQTQLVELAGGVPVWKGANPGSGWGTVSAEQILAWNPDVLVVITYKENSSDAAMQLKADLRLSSLKAVRSGMVRGFPQDFYSWDQPDTRWGLGLLWLSGILQPGSMPGLSIPAEARKFYQLFYGLSDAVFDEKIQPRMAGDWK